MVNYYSETELMAAASRLVASDELDIALPLRIVDCSGSGRPLLASGLPIELIDPGANIGFGPGANLGARAGTAPVILFLNPDVEPLVGALGEVARAGVADRAAAWTGALDNPDGTVQRNAGPCPTLGQLAAEYLLGRDTRLPPSGWKREVGVLTGAALFVAREFFDAVGGFSASLPLYMEDVDLSRRLASCGPIVQYPIRLGVHLGGRSARHAARSTWTLLHASRIHAYSQGRRSSWLAAMLIVNVGVLARSVLRDRSTLRWLPGLFRASAPGFRLSTLLPPGARGSA